MLHALPLRPPRLGYDRRGTRGRTQGGLTTARASTHGPATHGDGGGGVSTMSADPVTRSVELPNGTRLPYAERGDPAGVPLLLLHGYTDSWRSFAPVLAHLPPSVRAIAP